MSGVSKNRVLQRCCTFLFDCDGVLWNHSKLIPGAADLIAYLASSGRKALLITNNSSKSIEQYVNKCQTLGLPVTSRNILCSSNVAARQLHKLGFVGPVYVIGEAGIGLELDKCGITHFGIGPDEHANKELTNKIQCSEKPSCVLVGFDQLFNYRKLSKAVSFINAGIPFFATNDDAAIPTENGISPGVLCTVDWLNIKEHTLEQPAGQIRSLSLCLIMRRRTSYSMTHTGTGSLVAAVKYASGKEPTIFGKPHKPMFDTLQQDHSLNPKETLMIGDRLDTDILFGNTFGMHTACVLTGVTQPDLLARLRSSGSQMAENLQLPHLVFDSVADILDQLKRIDGLPADTDSPAASAD